MTHRTLIKSMEVYSGIETELTASASVVLMSSRLVDGRVDNFSHHPAFAEVHGEIPISNRITIPLPLWLITQARASFSPTTADPKLTGVQMIEQ